MQSDNNLLSHLTKWTISEYEIRMGLHGSELIGTSISNFSNLAIRLKTTNENFDNSKIRWSLTLNHLNGLKDVFAFEEIPKSIPIETFQQLKDTAKFALLANAIPSLIESSKDAIELKLQGNFTESCQWLPVILRTEEESYQAWWMIQNNWINNWRRREFESDEKRLDIRNILIPLSFVFGITRLSISKISKFNHGDIILFDKIFYQNGKIGSKIFAGNNQLSVAYASIEGNEVVILERYWANNMNDDDQIHPRQSIDAINLHSIELDIRFELDKKNISLGELSELKSGHVFILDQPVEQANIRLLVNGQYIGYGGLIAVGDKLGVRLSKIADLSYAQ